VDRASTIHMAQVLVENSLKLAGNTAAVNKLLLYLDRVLNQDPSRPQQAEECSLTDTKGVQVYFIQVSICFSRSQAAEWA
jgi:hypothetical protein